MKSEKTILYTGCNHSVTTPIPFGNVWDSKPTCCPDCEKAAKPAFEYQCACSYPYGPHTTHCIITNDMRLEAQCRKLADCGDEEGANALWNEGLKSFPK